MCGKLLILAGFCGMQSEHAADNTVEYGAEP
jgi:hypothetical protein